MLSPSIPSGFAAPCHSDPETATLARTANDGTHEMLMQARSLAALRHRHLHARRCNARAIAREVAAASRRSESEGPRLARRRHDPDVRAQHPRAVTSTRTRTRRSCATAARCCWSTAGSGFGQVVGREATDLAIERVKETGVVCVGLRNAHHLGRIGAYGERCGRAGLVSVHFVNVVGHEPQVSPWGGRERRMTTNPFCCVVPRDGDEPVVLDMATSAIALGKVRVAHMKGARDRRRRARRLRKANRPTIRR